MVKSYYQPIGAQHKQSSMNMFKRPAHMVAAPVPHAGSL